MPYFLALDAGTGSCRAVLFNENGKQLGISSREWVHKNIPEIPGSMEFNTEENWSLLATCIKDVIHKTGIKNIDAISSTSMREGIVVYDKTGKELWACANVDARAVEEVRSLRERGLENQFYRTSGQTFALGAAPRLLWLKNHEKSIYEKIDRVIMLSDWVAVRLGAPLAVDRSNGGTTGLYDLETRSWSSDLIQKAGLKETILATPVFNSGEKIGELSKNMADELGLRKGIPIIMGGGDAQLGTIGIGAIHPKDVAIFGGTFWQQEVNFDNPPMDPTGKIRINFHAVPNVWQAETIVFFAGLAVRWIRDALFPDLKAHALDLHRDPYSILDEMAEQVPVGSHGVIPIFSDAMDYSHWIHASPTFTNLSVDPEKCNRVTLYRALLENTAIVVKSNLERIMSLDNGLMPQNAILASGASKGTVWPQIIADALGIPIKIPVVKEATALGAAICSGVGIGVYSSFKEAIEKTVTFERVVEPNLKNKEIYSELQDRWSNIYKVQLELTKQGFTESLWRAPGE